ncbi:hypothetical protein ACFDTO_34900 [Microbacteriaceae bacterium 4G12]
MQLKVSVIFNKKPEEWGLRGDPFLWNDLENAFSQVLLPCTEEEFMLKMNEYFLTLTGHDLEENNDFYVEQYNKGGMSSGYICPEFWRNELVPLLIQRLLEYN